MEDPEKLFELWNDEIKKSFELLLPGVHKLREKRKAEVKLKIWLGGPGAASELYVVRETIANLLKTENCEVHFSESYSGGADLPDKELEEIESSNMAIIIAITPGASAEAVEFANHNSVHNKLFVYVPKEYENGYVVRSLFGKHGLILEDSFFSLENLRKSDAELAKKIINRAIDCRSDVHRQLKIQSLIDS